MTAAAEIQKFQHYGSRERVGRGLLTKVFSGSGVVRRRPLQCLVWTFLFILYVYYINCRPLVGRTTPPKPPPPLDDIPKKIWQIFSSIDSRTDSIRTWITENLDYQYTLVSSVRADAFALKHYSDRREILYTFLSLRVPVLRSALLRYMLLESEGGVYSDFDTAAPKPVDEWIPPQMKSTVRAVVSIENHQGEAETYPGVEGPRLQFCHRIMAASRGHPLMSRVVTDVVEALQGLAIDKGTTIAELRRSDDEVAQISGSVIWTGAVLKTLSEATETEVSWRNFTGMKEPRVFGDVLVLPAHGLGS